MSMLRWRIPLWILDVKSDCNFAAGWSGLEDLVLGAARCRRSTGNSPLRFQQIIGHRNINIIIPGCLRSPSPIHHFPRGDPVSTPLPSASQLSSSVSDLQRRPTMLSDDEAWAVLMAAKGCAVAPLSCGMQMQQFKLFGSRRNSIAPTCAWFQIRLIGESINFAWQPVGNLLRLWHALASCPGFSVSENPAFWRRVLRHINPNRQDHLERALFFDVDPHAFPRLRLTVSDFEYERDPVVMMRTLEQVFQVDQVRQPSPPPPHPQLVAALAKLQPHMDMNRFARPIPVQLVYQVPHRLYLRPKLAHDCSRNITRLHNFLLTLPSSTVGSTPSTHTTAFPRPQFMLQSVRLVGIYNLSGAMYSELASLLDDPRLHGITFPRIGVAKINRTSRETWLSFLQFVIRPNTGDFAPMPRLPQVLTLECSHVPGHMETFFQLLPFTRAIHSLTLNGMGDDWQLWAWLGFSLFHPAASSSSLRKLSFLRRTTWLEPRTLMLFTACVGLRMTSADDFARVVESYTKEREADEADGHEDEQAAVMDALRSILELRSPTIPSALITSITIGIHTKPSPVSLLLIPHQSVNESRWCSPLSDMTAWTLVLATLAPTLKHIYVTPLYCHVSRIHDMRLDLASDAVVMLVRKCPRLVSLSIPMRAWTQAQLSELLETTRATLHSLEVHAPADAIHQLLEALNTAQCDHQYALRHVSLVVHTGCLVRNGDSLRLIEELLLLYASRHMIHFRASLMVMSP